MVGCDWAKWSVIGMSLLHSSAFSTVFTTRFWREREEAHCGLARQWYGWHGQPNYRYLWKLKSSAKRIPSCHRQLSPVPSTISCSKPSINKANKQV